MKVWWLAKGNNFGDLLTPYILDYFKIPYEYVPKPHNANCICVGSIAHKATSQTVVLGSGIIRADEKISPDANWMFVRGPRTRARVLEVGGVCPEIYGDPGLLLPYFCKESKKEFDIGIVPHFVDYNIVKNRYPNHKIIDVINSNPLEVAKEISKCRYIISSSLHGIIAAHSYGIPAAWVKFSDNLHGDGIKFIDYYESVNLTAVPSTVENPIFTCGTVDLQPIVNIFQSLK